MNDLVEYLGKLEERVNALEAENANLRSIVPAKESVDGNIIARYVSNSLPQTDIINHSFLRRAFAVYGHFFVANLIVSAVVFLIYLCLMAVLFGSALEVCPEFNDKEHHCRLKKVTYRIGVQGRVVKGDPRLACSMLRSLPKIGRGGCQQR
ncbi:MAG: hypothetical protein MZV70_17635 [Desulfobacterales bacterium]|nr:hypothetical protein [Desulfobacterales bacterium]